MTCAEFKELAAAAALRALEPGEQAQALEHLTRGGTHEGCPQLYAEMLATAAALGRSLEPHQPSEAVWVRIEASLGLGARKRGGRALAWGLAIAALLAAIVLLADRSRLSGEAMAQRARAGAAEAQVAGLQRQLSAMGSMQEEARKRCQRDLESMRGDLALQREATALLERPTTRVMAMKPTQGAYQASAIYNPEARRAIILSNALPGQAGKDYELWIIRGKAAPIPAGLMHQDGNGIAVGEVDPKLLAQGGFDALAISLEPAGGRPTPTQVLLVGSARG